MINYYEVLEVSEKASDEIIEKAYRVLAKKYHPDLQQGNNKKVAEEKMKIINEAYDILSNNDKREQYNRKLKEQRENEELKQQANNNYYTNSSTSRETNNINNYAKQNDNNYNQNNYYKNQAYDKQELKRQQKFKENLEREARKRYLDAYDNYLRSLGYKVRYRWTWERTKALIITILIFAISLGILWIIPSSKAYMINLYEENFIIKIIVNIIKSLIDSFISIFKK